MAERIDAHHHLWRYSAGEYGWLDDGMSALRRDFLPLDLEREAASAHIDGAIAVQARQSLQETDWLLGLAENSSLIRGVVGWAPLASESFEAELERLRDRPKLRGLRHVVQAEPDDFLLGAEFHRGIAALRSTGLVYDILIFERHLPQTIAFVDRHPDQVFVLDHVAKPRIAGGLLEPWKRNVAELAKRPNVTCKVSGMVTEADWRTWTPETLRPYLDAVLESFGPARLMAGSDWPVCLVASGYKQWFEVLDDWAAPLTEAERARIFGGTATEIYRLG